MRYFLLFFLLFIDLKAQDKGFIEFLELSGLNKFSQNIMHDEQQNLIQFRREIQNFSCLSDEGKKESQLELMRLENEINANKENLQQNLQEYMQQFLYNNFTLQAFSNATQILNNTTYGQRIKAAIEQTKLDILNLNIKINYTPTHKESEEITNKKLDLSGFMRLASFDTKRQILFGNKTYRKDLEEGIQKLQAIFMREGCGIE